MTDFRPQTLVQKLHDGFDRLSQVMRSDIWSAAKSEGLNPTQVQVLTLLSNRTNSLKPRDIAAEIGVTPASIADTLAALERKGLVQKQPDPQDRRAVRVTLTDQGKATLGRITAGTTALASALDTLDDQTQSALLLTQINLIAQLQSAGAIPLQRLCVTCTHFRPDAHPGADRGHHCAFIDAAIGTPDLRLDCSDHEPADPAKRAATRMAKTQGTPPSKPDT